MTFKKTTLLFLPLLLLGGAYFGIYHVAPYAIIQPYRAAAAIPELPAELLLSQFQLQSIDSLELHGLHLRSDTAELRGVVLLVHGIGSCKEHMIPLAVSLAQEGMACLWMDGRAQGQSQGRYCTYGYYEKFDIQQLVRQVQAQYLGLPIGIWGNSLGGAVALQALELEENLAFGIIESTFTNLNQIVYDYQKRMLFGIGAQWATRRALGKAGELANFPPSAVSPIQSVRQIEQPVLIAHGAADGNISAEYGKQLFEGLASSDKKLIIVPGAGHNNVGATGGAAYWEQIMGFIERQLR